MSRLHKRLVGNPDKRFCTMNSIICNEDHPKKQSFMIAQIQINAKVGMIFSFGDYKFFTNEYF